MSGPHTVAAAVAALGAEGLDAHSWSNGPGYRYPAHSHGYDKALFCVAGSITFHTPAGDVALAAGERLDLPAGTEHAATVGPAGVTCVEAAKPTASD